MANFEVGKVSTVNVSKIIYNTEVLKSNLFDYNNVYILGKGNVIVTITPVTYVSYKNCAPFTKYIVKIDEVKHYAKD